MKNNKDLWTLIIALALPVLLIIVMAFYLYLPAIFVKPQTNFIYYSGSYTENEVSYKVVNNRLTVDYPTIYNQNNAIRPIILPNSTIDKNTAQSSSPDVFNDATYSWPDIYLYNTLTNESQKITLAQAKIYNLSTDSTSPDGFTIDHGSSGGGFPFGYSSGNYYTQYLKKGGYSKKLNINYNQNNPYNFNFLGWVVK